MESRDEFPSIVGLIVVVLLVAAATSGLTPPVAHASGEQPPSTGIAAWQGITFKRLTLDDGLSQSSIYCMVQDAEGFMWFGTEDGLNRYDGYEIQVYRHNPEDPYSLSDNHVVACRRDERDVVWFFTRDGTVHRYVPESGDFTRYDLEMEDPFDVAGQGFTAMHADTQGRLWIGTIGDGLFRYDSEENSFSHYEHDPDDPTSLSHRLVHRVLEDHQGVIWVGTEGGLNRYEAESDTFVRYPYRDFPPGGYQYDPPVHNYDPAFQPDNPYALASPAATRLLEDREGRLWIGTRYGGLHRLDRATGHFTAYPFDPAFEPKDPSTFSGNSVRQLLEDRRGHIWVSSAHWNLDETRTYARLGLERLDPDTGVITRYPANSDDPCSPPHNAVWRMYEDVRGTLWFHTFAGGVEIYDWETDCFEHYGHDPNDPESLGGEGITGFYEDEAGGLWIGTNTSGVNLYDPTWSKFPHYRLASPGSERLSNNSIRFFAISPERLDDQGQPEAFWVSTFAGLNYWDRPANAFTFYEIDPKLPDNQAYAILEDAQRRKLWLGTSMGLERVVLPDDMSGAPETLDVTRVLTRSSASVGFVLDLHAAGPDHMWVAQYGVGLHRYDLVTEAILETYRHDPDNAASLGDDRVQQISPGRDDRLWLLTATGIEHFDPASGVFTHTVRDLEDLQSVGDRVSSLYEDEAGVVWLGTNGQGLQRLDPEMGRVTATYGEEEGLPNNVVYCVLPDDAGHLWLSTNLGLTRFDPATETFQGYTSADGLQSNEFNHRAAFRAPDGELFFGGVNGINTFYPETIAPIPYVPPVVITEIRLGPPRPPRGSKLPGSTGRAGSETFLQVAPQMAQAIEVSHRDRVLSFEFASLHYAMPDRNQYAYRLDGFDRDWNYVGNQRFATYTNLPPGAYTFRVKATNSDGVWNEEGASVVVTVTPPFWRTWWFRGIVSLLLVGSAVAGYRLRVRSMRIRSRELEAEVATRTRELAAVNTIAAVVSRSLNLDRLLAEALDETLAVMGTQAGGIYLLDESGDHLHLAIQRGFSPDLVAEIEDLAVGEGFSGRVAQSGKALVVRDLSEDPRLTRMAVKHEGLRSLVVVPLRAKRKVLGTLFTVTRGYRAFSKRDKALLDSIGRQIGVAVENAALYEDTRHRLAQLKALQRTTTAVASTLELERLLRLIIQQAVDLLQAAGGILNLVDWEAWEDEVVAATGSATPSLGRRGSLFHSLSGWATLHKQPTMANDVREDDRVDGPGLSWLERQTERPTRNAAVAPLIVKDRAVGTLAILDKEGGEARFQRSDLDLLQSFANQAATAIENARLFEAEQRRAEQFRVISEVGQRTTSILSIDELLNEIVHLIQKSFNYDVVEIGLVEGKELTFRAGVARESAAPFSRFRLSVGEEGITGQVAATGEPLLIPDVGKDERYLPCEYARTKTGSELAVPIETKERVIGVLNVESAQPDAFDESDLAVMQALANQAATAIENARLFETEQRRAEQFRVISEVGQRTTSILSIDELLEEMVHLIQDGFDYDIVEIGLVEGKELAFSAGVDRGLTSAFPGFRVPVGRGGITGRVAAKGEPIVVPDVSQDDRFVQFTDSRTKTRSELAVPIETKERVIGVLNIQSAKLDAFDESDLAVMQSLADQAATAIENARLFEAEQRRAEQFRVIGEVGRHITSILTVDELLEEIVRLIRESFGYYLVTVGLIEEGKVIFKAGVKTGWPETQFLPPSVDVGGRGITAWVAATGEPLMAPDVTKERRFLFLPESSETGSEVAVPLKTKSGIIGVLNVESDQINAFDESDKALLESLASQAAIAIENARLYQQARRLAVVEERQRLARELHDSVTQALYGTTLYAEAAARQLSSGQVDLASEHLRELGETAQEALREMRLLIFELRPSVLESDGLVNALRARLEAVEERAGLEVAFHTEGEVVLPTPVEEGLYRIAQEALNNALKHACAGRISVSLSRGEDSVVLEVVDDGCGFDPDAAIPAGGLGLDGIIERAAQMAGDLVLDSAPGEGTRVRVEVPQ